MNDTSNNIEHYGTLRHSGRYPWGSGGDLLDSIDSLKAKGLTETEIARGLGMKGVEELRARKSLAKADIQEAKRVYVIRELEAGYSIAHISRESGIPESTIRDLRNATENTKYQIVRRVADILKAAVDKFGYVDIGKGIEVWMGVNRTKFKNAVYLLKNEGYTTHYLVEQQMGTRFNTSHVVLAAPGTTWKEVHANRAKIAIPNATSSDKGETFNTQPTSVRNIDGSRVKMVYSSDKDGLIELRRGVPELSMGGNNYSQVRIAIDGDKYAKGMAIYGQKMPDGVDILVHTSKTPKPGDPLYGLKPQKIGEENPFGASFKTPTFTNKSGKQEQSALNIVNEEGDWEDWSRNLSSQFLGKQPLALAKRQLSLQRQLYQDQYEEIMALTNPVVKERLLADLGDTVDAAAVHLKAAAMPGQSTAVIIPAATLRPNECYSPRYPNGTVLSLVRHPHGGPFESPQVVVNNNNSEMRKVLGTDVSDVIGIHPSVAAILSGADFDGDNVIQIPNASGAIRTAPPLKGLENFDSKLSYPTPKAWLDENGKLLPDAPKMTDDQKQREMGRVSNLITDMTIKGASEAEIARAVRHSMVVIDAEKHALNWKQSELDNGIASLKEKYQGGPRSGAATLLSRAKSEDRIPQRKIMYTIDPYTGEKVYAQTNETYIDKRTGEEIFRTQKTTKMASVLESGKSAHTLSSGSAMEAVYANHADSLHALANQARKSQVSLTMPNWDSNARKVYKAEIASLDAKYEAAKRHAPLERKAQLLAQEMYYAKIAKNPSLSARSKQEERGKALVAARKRIGATKPAITFTPREWEAIQMGAISHTRLRQMLIHADMDQVRTLATPKSTPTLSAGKQSRAKSLLNAGYTVAEVAAALGTTVTQISNIK